LKTEGRKGVLIWGEKLGVRGHSKRTDRPEEDH